MDSAKVAERVRFRTHEGLRPNGFQELRQEHDYAPGAACGCLACEYIAEGATPLPAPPTGREMVEAAMRFDELNPHWNRRPAWRDYSLKRRHAVRAAGKMTVDLRTLGERDGWRCYWGADCVAPDLVIDYRLSGMDSLGPTIEHIVPVSAGGTNATDNLAVSHRVCNVTYGARRP